MRVLSYASFHGDDWQRTLFLLELTFSLHLAQHNITMPPKKPKKEQDKAQVDESFQAVDISAREPRTVILMLSSSEPTVVVKALQALHQHMLKSDQNCKSLTELGVVDRLIELLSSLVKATRSYAALCLSVMATSADVRSRICAADGLSPLLALLKPEEEMVTVEHATSILSRLAKEYSTKTTLLSLSAHQQLLPLITGEDANVQRHALETLEQLVELFHARRAVAEDGGMAKLLSVLTSEYPTLQQLTLQTLSSCMNDKDCRERFREADGLSTIVSFLENKDLSDVHLLAATVLSLCLHDAENMTALQTSGSLDQLLSLVTDSAANVDMKRCSTEALAQAAKDEVNRKILHEQNLEKTFIELLTHSDGPMVIAALEGLGTMCALSSGQARIGQEGGVTGVVSCAGREVEEVRGAAGQCLAHISTDSPANCKLILEADGCPAIVNLLSDSRAISRSGAATTITNMASNPLAREELMTNEAIAALVSCLEFEEIEVQRSACEALTMMSLDSEARKQFLSSGGVALCLPLLSSANPGLLTSALYLVHSMAQCSELAQEFSGSGALQLLTQLSKRSHAPSAVGPALKQLLNFDLSAKWWTLGYLESGDLIQDIEFFDPGLGLSQAQPFSSLSSLLSQPLHMNRPIITANLINKAPPTSAETTPTPEIEHPSPSQPRSKSRTNKSRKGQEVESKISGNTEEPAQQEKTIKSEPSKESGCGQLPVDHGLQKHISHVVSNFISLSSPFLQAESLAIYVCNSMGGPLNNTRNTTFELPQSELQKEAGSNVIPIGDVTVGTYRHRALLYKVLADQLGLPCTLTRGDYNRHWNVVTIATDTTIRNYVVDLMTSERRLLELGSPEAQQYCHI